MNKKTQILGSVITKQVKVPAAMPGFCHCDPHGGEIRLLKVAFDLYMYSIAHMDPHTFIYIATQNK